MGLFIEANIDMSITKPFHRNYRPVIKGPNSGYSDWAYIVDPEYAKTPEHYVRAFRIIQKDLMSLFEYVEPSDTNLQTYSFRIHELLIRTCIEVEANFKAILRENIFTPTKRKNMDKPENEWNMNDYQKVNKTHHLDSYIVKLPIWEGEHDSVQPYAEWKDRKTLGWYDVYNQSKHDRQNQFKLANIENLISAVAGLLVLLSSQFKCEDFSPGEQSLAINTDSYYTGTVGIGGYFRIEFPNDWGIDEKYDFNWDILKKEKERFGKIDYNNMTI